MDPWRALGWVGIAAVVLYCLTHVGTVVLSIIVGLFVAALLAPPARWLMRRGLGRSLATVITFLGGLLLAGGLFALLVPTTVSGLAELRASVGTVLERLHALAANFGLDFGDLVAQGRQWVEQRQQQITTGAVAGVRTATEIIVGAVLAVILGIYFVHGGDRLFHWLTGLFPAGARQRLREAGPVAFGVIGRYIRGVAIVGAVDAFFIGTALWILGVPIAVPLAVLTWVGAFLPIVGAFTAGLLAAVVAFVAKGWLIALIVVGVTVLVQQIEGHVLAPQIYGKALDLPGAVILIAIAIGSLLFGIAGAFLASPVASVIVALLNREDFSEGRARV
ncbi:AI-2E family transporter [Nonomuraea ferruginea]|uniref:AI-2E family transporter n=1 Tax=Nonomuraea ferruginea TaxID=46174 RepID=A0ABT4SQC4_9ACTN|nr:AI-2E family transporter [Nonomuraea ferruginea]MDA0639458.1 AI-2E family transporter [Nonomuraea ferruginea]